MVKIFISHSSLDSDVARMVAEILRTSMHLFHNDIRCTSVDGYRLPGGADTHDVLKNEIMKSEVLIALISQESLKSTYVLFELGARWGAGLYMVPLLAPSVPVGFLKAPLSGLNALRCDNASQMHQLVSDVSNRLNGTTSEPAHVYQNQIDTLTRYNTPKSDKISDNFIATKSEKTTIVNKKENDEDLNKKIINRHCKSQWPNDYSMRIHCIKEQKKALSKILQKTYHNVPDDVIKKIRGKSANEWPDDFTMRLHREKEQVKAYRELSSLD